MVLGSLRSNIHIEIWLLERGTSSLEKSVRSLLKDQGLDSYEAILLNSDHQSFSDWNLYFHKESFDSPNKRNYLIRILILDFFNKYLRDIKPLVLDEAPSMQTDIKIRRHVNKIVTS